MDSKKTEILTLWNTLKVEIIKQNQELQQLKSELKKELEWWKHWRNTPNPQLAQQLSQQFPHQSLISLSVGFKCHRLDYQGDFIKMKTALQTIKNHYYDL